MTEPAPESGTDTKFHFVGLHTRRLVFLELPAPAGGVRKLEPGETRPMQVQFELAVAVKAPERQLQTTLSVTAIPDPAFQPYRIEASISGTFKADEGVGEDDLNRFARTAVPTILFPYVREIIHMATRDGLYGPVRMNPVNLAALVGPEGWEEVSASSERNPASPT